MLVTQRQFESTVSAAAAQVTDPRAGFQGPSSMSWRIGKETVIFMGGGCAALLQLAHPYVAHGVDQHSETRSDPIGRFNRTFLHVFNMIFGSQAEALESSQRVRAIHDAVHGPITENVGRFERGHRYRAHDHDALQWVHATLIHTAVRVYDLAVRPLSWAERDQYYQESKSFAALFGIERGRMPATWTEFDAYVNAMVVSDTIRVGTAGRELAQYLLTPPSQVSKPFFDWYVLMTAGLLPDSVRAQFGMRFSAEHERIYHASFRTLRHVVKVLPPRVRYVPAYHEAKRRLAGKEGPDVIGRALEQTVLRVLAPAASTPPSMFEAAVGKHARAASRCPVA
ncbi:MAG: oxygenase MpaB family protein [Polyangiales bacterium]|nr:DUF2236 domain-containing protein [Myxococcales bacterium]MCB9660759.1 DUF2236 domain-containing protein [Sandaracinaceae bacterium]